MRVGVARRVCTVVVAGAVVAALPATAGAATINVHPGGVNKIQKAVNRADNGDTLRIHGGRYEETPQVDKRLTLTAAGDGVPLVDGECDVLHTLDVDHNGVVIDGLKVVGAQAGTAAAEVNFEHIEKGTARDLTLRDTCGDGPHAGAEYGVNVYQGERITVEDSSAKGFSDAGIYIGDITSTGADELVVQNNETFGNNRGIIIEEVEPPADVEVLSNETHHNDLGIFVHVSDQVLFHANSIHDNGTAIGIDNGSDDNVFTNNTFNDNDVTLDDDGSGNCGVGNTPEPFDPC